MFDICAKADGDGSFRGRYHEQSRRDLPQLLPQGVQRGEPGFLRKMTLSSLIEGKIFLRVAP